MFFLTSLRVSAAIPSRRSWWCPAPPQVMNCLNGHEAPPRASLAALEKACTPTGLRRVMGGAFAINQFRRAIRAGGISGGGGKDSDPASGTGELSKAELKNDLKNECDLDRAFVAALQVLPNARLLCLTLVPYFCAQPLAPQRLCAPLQMWAFSDALRDIRERAASNLIKRLWRRRKAAAETVAEAAKAGDAAGEAPAGEAAELVVEPTADEPSAAPVAEPVAVPTVTPSGGLSRRLAKAQALDATIADTIANTDEEVEEAQTEVAEAAAANAHPPSPGLGAEAAALRFPSLALPVAPLDDRVAGLLRPLGLLDR